MSVSDIYAAFDSEGITNGHEMARCLRCAAHQGKADRVLDTHAEWDFRTGCNAFGHPAHFAYLPWFNYIRMGIDAGYYAVAMINFEGTGEPETNHWVLVCGARTEGSVHGKTITGEVLVSCSVRGEQWHEARDFLKRMGGYDSLLVRPA